MLVASIVLACNSQCYPGPDNVTIEEGENNVLIHCPFSVSAAPIWSINSTLREPESLKQPLMLITTGLNVAIVDKSYNNTTFQCFLPNGNELEVFESCIGTLRVTKNSKCTHCVYNKCIIMSEFNPLIHTANYHPPAPNQQLVIVLDHQNFFFNSTHRTIAWKIENIQSCSLFQFVIRSSTSEMNNIVNSWSTQNFNLTLTSSDFVQDGTNELLYFNITANGMNQTRCSATSLIFQIIPDGMLIYYY